MVDGRQGVALPLRWDRELDGDQDGSQRGPLRTRHNAATAKSTIAPLMARRQLPATDRNAVT
jgi:hypothetical protein